MNLDLALGEGAISEKRKLGRIPVSGARDRL